MNWMMKSPSILKQNSDPLFLDTSVLINLLACGKIGELAGALGRPMIVEETVVRETRWHPKTKEDGTSAVRSLVGARVLQMAQMNEAQAIAFLELVGAASPDDLDDGEAATLAITGGQGAVVIDERKGRRVAGEKFPELQVLSTLDIICCPQVIDQLGLDESLLLVTEAKNVGRKRILPSWRDWLRFQFEATGLESNAI